MDTHQKNRLVHLRKFHRVFFTRHFLLLRIAVPLLLCFSTSLSVRNPRRTSDFKRGDVADARFCYCSVTVLLLFYYCLVLYCTVRCCTVVSLSCLLAQHWSYSFVSRPLVQFPLFSAVLFVLTELVSSLDRFTNSWDFHQPVKAINVSFLCRDFRARFT